MLLTKGNVAGPMRYDNIDEIYYVLDGRITLLLDHRIEEVWKGDFAFIPRNSVFVVRVDSETARALIWHTPSGIIERHCL
jgi:mannose-6-phosphate isomerase-like protein (cupin superfamily)